MFKRIIIALIILGFIGGLGYSYLYFKKKKQPVSNTLSAIPSTAAFIIESKNPIETWGSLSSSNIIWSELQSTEYFSSLSQTIEAIDSIRLEHQDFNTLLQKQSVFISAHMSGAHAFDFLFCISIPNTIPEEQVFEFINSKLKSSNTSNKVYDKVTINTSNFGKNKASYAFHNGIFIISKSIILIEDAIRQLNTGSSLLDVSDFNKVVHTAGQNIDANLYINYKVFPNILVTFLSEYYTKNAESFADLANWSEIDLSLKPNAIAFNGFTYSNDSINNYLNVFIDQKPVKQKLLEIVPKNTACIIRTGFSDFKQFQKRYKTYLEKNNQLFEFGAKLKVLELDYEFNTEDEIYSWIGNEVAIVITEPKSNNFSQQSFAVLHSNNIEFAAENLNNLTNKANLKTNTPLDSSNYKDFIIKKLEIPQLLSSVFNNAFKPITEHYYTIIGDFVVFANTELSIRDFINYYLNKKTLLTNEEFEKFYENISSESNLLIFSNISRSTSIYQSFLNDEYKKHIKQYSELFKKFDGLAIQISKDKNNMYYNNVLLHYNPVYKQETSSLWETQLENNIKSLPQIVKNHKTGAKDIVVQDEANILYQISNTGKIQWKKQLNETIIGEIQQIDIYKNGKLQLLFNTASQLHLIDRNGNYVEGYPVKFESKATNPISVLDYDNNKNYRILVALQNKKIINYEATGKIVNGWEFKTSKEIISQCFELLQINGKDYIIGVDIKGKVYVIDRKGEHRLNLTNTIAANKPFYLTKKKTINSSYLTTCDSLGNIINLKFNDSLQTINIDKISEVASFAYEDINEDMSKDYIMSSENNISVFDQDLQLIFEINFDETISQKPQPLKLNQTKTAIGITLNNNEIHLISESGINKNGFPLIGTTPFAIGDINKDKSIELIVGGNEGLIYSYTLEN